MCVRLLVCLTCCLCVCTVVASAGMHPCACLLEGQPPPPVPRGSKMRQATAPAGGVVRNPTHPAARPSLDSPTAPGPWTSGQGCTSHHRQSMRCPCATWRPPVPPRCIPPRAWQVRRQDGGARALCAHHPHLCALCGRRRQHALRQLCGLQRRRRAAVDGAVRW